MMLDEIKSMLLTFKQTIRDSFPLMKNMLVFVYLLLLQMKISFGKMEPFIVGGHFTKISKHPHSVFLSFHSKKGSWRCGGSILNQKIVLTAAHCYEDANDATKIVAVVGSEDKNMGFEHVVLKYRCHENYDPEEATNDVCLNVLKRALHLNRRISRVSIMRYPPYKEPALIAGWGLVDEIHNKEGDKLKAVPQKYLDRNQCIETLGKMHTGTFCAGLQGSNQYASEGDSGSALLVRGYIQIGLVSYKVMQITRDTVVYTDVGYFYHWIRKNAASLYCFGEYKNG